MNWRVRKGAILLQRWNEGENYPFRLFDSSQLEWIEGALYKITKGNAVLVKE